MTNRSFTIELPEEIEVPITKAANHPSWPDDLDTFVTVTTGSWDVEWLLKVIFHGLKQVTNDGVSDPKKYPTPADIYEKCAKKADSLSDLSHGFGGTITGRVSIEETCERDARTTYARKNLGYKAVDAIKLSRLPQQFNREYAAYLSKKHDKDITPEMVAAAISKEVAPIVALKKAAKSTGDLTLE